MEQLSNLLRNCLQALRLGDPGHLDGCLAGWFFQPHIDQIQVEHFQQHIEQGANNLGPLAATPHGRKGDYADQIVNAAPQPPDLLSGMFELHFHVRPPSGAAKSARHAVREAHGGTPPAVQRTDSAGVCRR